MKLVFNLFIRIFLLLLTIDSNLAFNADGLINTPNLSEKTNLALRQTGHELLLIAGNDSSAIRPVQQINQQTFLLPITQSFDYDTLPYLLHHALSNVEMEMEIYYVAIKDCTTDTLILGYHANQFKQQEVPCIGRHQYATCNHIYLTFPNRKNTLTNSHDWQLLLSLLTISSLLFLYFYKKSKTKNVNQQKQPTIKPALEQPNLLAFGHCQLDLTNQYLFIHGTKKELTFREAKLLHYFSNHPNQLLTREKLLTKVWEEEGIIVGRSLDVFVSRLRKILKPDTSLIIKTVHGIGYRLEIIS